MLRIEKKGTPSKRHLTLSDLDYGDIFIYNGGHYLVFYNDADSIQKNNVEREEIYCLSLEGFELVVFNIGDCVELINKDIVIDYTNEDLKEWCD